MELAPPTYEKKPEKQSDVFDQNVSQKSEVGLPLGIPIFDESVSNARSITILSDSYFTFDKFEVRTGLWNRFRRRQQLSFGLMGVLNPLFCICVVPLMCWCAKKQDQVRN